MSNLLNQRRKSVLWPWISSLLALLSLFVGIWKGPTVVFALSTLGALFSLAAYWSYRPSKFPLVLLGIHALLITAAIVASNLFLRPLSDQAQQIPKLTHRYEDPDGHFTLRGPGKWTYERITSRFEAGVRIRPSEPGQYMGVSEITVLIRTLEKPPASPQKFLDSMSQTFAQNNSDRVKKGVQFEMNPVKSLDGEPALMARLTMKKLWVPLYQMSLYGIKERKVLCTVAATGLDRHSALAPILCLGLFETVKVPKR